MPIYEYRCANGHGFELRQDFHSEPRANCPTCSADSRRVILPVPVHYKGSGFYTTDYARKNPASETPSDASKANGKADAKTDAKAETKAEAKSETKPAAKEPAGSSSKS
jgi:putative FmdB family regulatory protein